MLRLGQLVYTSFAELGLRVLASAKVPLEARRALLQRIAFKHWDAYNPPGEGYRAVYLCQVTPQQNLFGWFYDDGIDELGRSHVPYFIGYYLAEPLLSSHLQIIFTCLQQGPVALVDREKPPIILNDLVISDLNYSPARPGVAISEAIRKQSYAALQQQQSLELFVSVDRDESIAKPNEQHEVDFSIYNPYLEEKAKATTVLNPITASEQQQSQQAVTAEGAPHLPGGDVRETAGTGERPAGADKRLMIDSQNTAEDNSMVAYRNIQLLLGIGIATTALALAGSIYGLLQSSVGFSGKLGIISVGPTFYKTFAEVPNVPRGLFNYGGATTFAPLRSESVVSAIEKAHPQYQLRYTHPVGRDPGSGTGIDMLLEGQLSFAQSSRPLKNTELVEAEERGLTLEQVPIAIDGIAFYVHPQVSIPGLSLSQIRDIFTGKITNWKEVEGQDLPIVPWVHSSQASGIADFIEENVLVGEKLASSVQAARTPTESLRRVANIPGAIGYATASIVVGQNSVRLLPIGEEAGQAFVPPFAPNAPATVNESAFANGSYPLTRRLFIVIKRDGRLDEQAGIVYTNLLLSDEGQRLIEQAGFVPIR